MAGLFDPIHAQVIHHTPREANVELLIRTPQEIENDIPVIMILGAEFPALLHILENGLQAHVHQVVSDAVGQRIDQFALLLEKRTLVGRRALIQIINLNLTDLPILHDDPGFLHPGGLAEFAGFVNAVFEANHRLTDIGILPARRQGFDCLCENLFDR